MRNRPDSRGRLAGLTPAGPLAPRGRSTEEQLPADDDEWPPPARYERVARRYVDGWVPDVVEPPGDLVEPLDDVVEPPGRADPESTADPAPGHRAGRVRYRPHHAWGRVAQRWVPEPLREARVDPGRRAALLLTVVAAVAALVAAVGVWRGQPEPRPVQAVSLAQVSGETMAAGPATTTGRTSPLRSATSARTTTTTTTAAAGSGVDGGPVVDGVPAVGPASGGATATTSADVLVVSVTGAVRHPGLVRLPPGSRVADAIAKAGGVVGAADLTGVNLAARLADGASVVVSDPAGSGSGSSVTGLDPEAGSGGPAGPGGATATSRAGQPAGKVDLNTADAAALDALPGVGPVTAAAIVAWREKNGRYTSVEQLQEIQGIGPAKYAALAPMVTV